MRRSPIRMHRSEGATALLGMDELVVGAQLEVAGEVWLLVETTTDVVGCDGCGTKAVGHGKLVVRVRDLPAGDRPVVLVVEAHLALPGSHCDVRTWSEETDSIAPRAALTEPPGAASPPAGSPAGWPGQH